MSMNNLSIDGEFRYIIQWFNEWSELQRDDFVPVLVEYLLQGSPGEVYMNGMVNTVNHAAIQDKPMSLFQCRIKLFREWNKKWPLELKRKLQEKIMEMDSKVAEKITKEIKIHGGEDINVITNGCNGNGSDIETSIEGDVENNKENSVIVASINGEPIEASAEEAINLDSQIIAVLNNETLVDDNVASDIIITTNSNSAVAHTVTTTTFVNSFIDTQLVRLEPAEQLQQSVLEENNIVDVDCNVTTSTTTVA
ncbi:uncharacterized protein [Eurosta solidaginis]|uniref:uncharacterized protein n=1 Tax=Eurosta solidaginis TaxID=178769 RepID=UPI0035308CDC